jgi:hypothetical protein
VNLDAYPGAVRLITITAPGTELLGWDCSGDHEGPCSGPKGCHVERAAATRWNRSAPRRWRGLHRVASQDVRRQFPGQLKILDRTWEYQRRGTLHVHVVVGIGTPAHMHAARLYADALAVRTKRWGFGFVDRKFASIPGQRAAAYLSSYLVTGKGHKMQVQDTVRREDVPASLVHISNELSQRTGVTMRTLRQRRYEWWKFRNRRPPIEVSLQAARALYASGANPDLLERLVVAAE